MRITALIVLLLACGTGGGMLRAQVQEERSFANPRIIGAAEGLLSTSIRDALMDDDGFLWIATAKGLHRFDGSHMRVLQHDPTDSTSLPADDVTCLLQARDGSLWVGTGSKGLARLDRNSLRCVRYTHRPDAPRSISDTHVVWAMEDRAGTLFFGTRYGDICRFNSASNDFDRFAFPRSDKVYEDRMRTHTYRMVQDRHNDQVYWCATSNGMLRIEAPHWSMRYLTMPEPNTAYNLHLRSNNFREVVQAPDGSLLASTWGAGIIHMDSTGERYRRYAIVEDGAIRQFANTFNALTVDQGGSIWAGNNTTGLAQLDTASATIRMLVPGDAPALAGLEAQGVNSLRTTPAGDLLVCTRQDVRLFSATRQRFRTLRFVSQSRPYAGMHVIRSLLPLDDGSVLLSGYGLDGIYHFRPYAAALERIAPPEAFWMDPSQEHFSVEAMVRSGPDEVLAIGAFHLYRIDLRTLRMTRPVCSFNEDKWNGMFQGLFRHSSGDLYVLGRHDGAIRIDSTLHRVAQFLPDTGDPHSIANGNYIYCAVEDRAGRIWLGHDRGFSILDPGTGRFLNLDPATRSDSIAQLANVRNMAIDPEGRIWMTDGGRGLVVIDEPLEAPFATRTISRKNDLPFDRVGTLFFDADGTCWLNGSGGLAQHGPNGWQVYGPEAGLPTGGLGGPLARTPHGMLMGATGRTLFWEHSSTPRPSDVPPRLLLATLRIFDKATDPATVQVGDALQFRHDQNFLKLAFSLLDVLERHPHHIQYRLTPSLGEWLHVGTDGVASFTNVPDGSHLLEVRAVGTDGRTLATWSMPLNVIPPWWRTWWFRSAVLIALLASAYAYYRMRINAVRNEARLKAEFDKRLADVELTALRAQMNPHFLFNALNSIRHHVLNSRPDEADRYLGKFARLIRLILDHSDQRTVPLADELQALKLYLELEASRFDDKFRFHIHVDPAVDTNTTMISPMLIQPYLENAIWHGLMQKEEGGALSLRIAHDDKRLRIEVEDDGIGRARAAEIKSRSALKKRSMGMSITQQRLAIIEKQRGIRCELRVDDLVLPDGEPGGTRVSLLIPTT